MDSQNANSSEPNGHGHSHNQGHALTPAVTPGHRPLPPAPAPRPGYPGGPAPYGYAGNPGNPDQDPFDQGGLLEYWRILRRRKGTVLLVAFGGLLLGILVTLPQTPIYQAKATLEIQDMNQNFLSMRESDPVGDSGRYNALTDIQTQIKILQSETLAERTVDKLGARGKDALSTPPPSRLSSWRKALNLPDKTEAVTTEDQLRATLRSLKVRAAGQTRIVEILYDSPNPKLAADFVNTLTNEFIDQNMEARWKMSQRTGDWLGRQLDEMRIKLERSEDSLQRYARQAGLVFTGEKQNVSEERLKQLQTELLKAQGERVQRQSRFEMAAKSAPETLPDILNDASLRELQTKITDLRRQEAELISTFKPEYSKVKRVQAQIEPLQTAFERERAAILQRIKNDYDEAQRREKLLADDYARQTQVVTGEAERSIQYNILKREVDTNRQLYEAMLGRVKESSIASAMRASNVRVVDAAKAPKKPYKPQFTMNALLGLAAGFLTGLGLVVIQERNDRTLQNPGDLTTYARLPELGIIPSDEKRKGLRTSPFESSSTRVDSVELVTHHRSPTMLADSFRVVLTSILFQNAEHLRPRVVVMTSGSPKEGKSTVTSNLGIALAQVGMRTLLVDADLRKPRLHQIFSLDNTAGLADFLRESDSTREAYHHLITATPIDGLFVLPAGGTPSLSINLLLSKKMPQLLTLLRREFDMILIDTPPMLQMPDARIIAKMSDGVVVVTRAGQTTRDAALATAQRLQVDQTTIIGAILNDWSPVDSPYGYYGYGKSGYHSPYHI